MIYTNDDKRFIRHIYKEERVSKNYDERLTKIFPEERLEPKYKGIQLKEISNDYK